MSKNSELRPDVLLMASSWSIMRTASLDVNSAADPNTNAGDSSRPRCSPNFMVDDTVSMRSNLNASTVTGLLAVTECFYTFNYTCRLSASRLSSDNAVRRPHLYFLLYW